MTTRAAATPLEIPIHVPRRNRAPRTKALLRRPGAAIALVTLLIMLGASIFAGFLVPYAPNAIDPVAQFRGPSAQHLFGTDELGRDVFSRIVYGGRLAFTITFGATAVTMILGTIWGILAASSSRWWDEVLMRVADTAMAIPAILFALIFIAAFGTTVLSLIVILGILAAPSTARIVRAAVSTELALEYRQAAIAYGASPSRVLLSEIVPNTAPTLLAQTSLVAAGVLLSEASLSFIGLGVQPPAASWGTLLQTGYATMYQSVWYILFPGAAIVLAILSLNTLGDHLQAILDPNASRDGEE